MRSVWVALLVVIPVVVLGSPPVAHACGDFVDQRFGSSGHVPTSGYLGDVAVDLDGSVIVTSNTERVRFDESGVILHRFPGADADTEIHILPSGDVAFVGGDIERFSSDGLVTRHDPIDVPQLGVAGFAATGELAIAQGGLATGPEPEEIGRVTRYDVDGEIDSSFGDAGTATITTVPDANVLPGHLPFVIGTRATTDGVEVLVSWTHASPMSTVQLLHVAADGVTSLVLSRQLDGFLRPAADATPGDPWRLLAVSSDYLSEQIVVLEIDREAGTIDIRHRTPSLDPSLIREDELRFVEDGHGLIYVSTGGALLALDDDGNHPLLSNGRPGEWLDLREIDDSSLTRIVAGLALTDDGRLLVTWRTSVDFDGVYALRGDAEPSRFVVGGLSAEVDRLYRAALGRLPDGAGRRYWREERARGASLEDLAARFMSSDEFVESFGDLDDRAFIEQLYVSVLRRPGDTAGIDFWTAQLATDMTRADVLVFFAESVENVNLTRTLRSDPDEAALYRLYQAVFLRPPDSSGNCFWYLGLGARTLDGTAEEFTRSAEFEARYGSLDDAEFVDLLYRNVLGRPADAAGSAFWTDRLRAGSTRGEVVVGFSESAEFRLTTDT